jgi:hypothetical protein
MMEIDPEILYVNSTIDPLTQIPLVYFSHKGISFTLTLTEARNRGLAIFQAAAIAESEAAVFHAFGKFDRNSKAKGFDKNKAEQSDIFGTQVLTMVREFRQPLPEYVDTIFGLRTKQGIVILDWQGMNLQLPPDRARQHALHILECAEASESDAFFYAFLMQTLEVTQGEANVMIQEFQLFRRKNYLEDLLRSDRP